MPAPAFPGLIAAVQPLNAPAQLLTDEYRYKILRLLEENPQLSQRDLADQLGISLGKANYCLQALIERGLVKARNFRNSQNRSMYLYLLTRKGITEKTRSATRFLQIKMAEYEALQREIELLKREQGRQQETPGQ